MYSVVTRTPRPRPPRIRDATARAHDSPMHRTHLASAHKPLRVVLAVATTLLASAVYVGSDQRVSATPAGVNGRISFMRNDADGHWQIWTANPDLTSSHQITDGDFDSGWAVWSPDGTRLAFNSTREDSNHTDVISDIFVMNADGNHVTKLTQSVNWSEGPAWSPTGDLIAFISVAGPDPDEQGALRRSNRWHRPAARDNAAHWHGARLLPRVSTLFARWSQPRVHRNPGRQGSFEWVPGRGDRAVRGGRRRFGPAPHHTVGEHSGRRRLVARRSAHRLRDAHGAYWQRRQCDDRRSGRQQPACTYSRCRHHRYRPMGACSLRPASTRMVTRRYQIMFSHDLKSIDGIQTGFAADFARRHGPAVGVRCPRQRTPGGLGNRTTQVTRATMSVSQHLRFQFLVSGPVAVRGAGESQPRSVLATGLRCRRRRCGSRVARCDTRTRTWPLRSCSSIPKLVDSFANRRRKPSDQRAHWRGRGPRSAITVLGFRCTSRCPFGCTRTPRVRCTRLSSSPYE